MKNIAENFR